MGVIEFVVIACILCFIAYIVTTLLTPPAIVVKMIWAVIGLVLLFMFIRAVGFVDPKIPHMR